MIDVSVIIPCYNSAKTIKRTLDSLRNQLYKNFEVIIIDDGSKDETREVVRDYTDSSCLNIRYYHQINKGVSVARNYGLQVAQGRYVTFIDADDVYHPSFIERLRNVIKKHNSDFVLCKYQESEFKDSYSVFSSEIQMGKYELLNIYFQKRKNAVGFWGGIYKKSIIDKYHLKFPEGVKYGEDSEFICKYLYHCDEGTVFLAEKLYGYIPVASSAMRKPSYDKVDNIGVYKRVLEYWQGEISEKTVILERAIWSCAKDFAINDKLLYWKLINEYDVEAAMKKLCKSDEERLVILSSYIYRISANLFRICIRLYGKLLIRICR